MSRFLVIGGGSAGCVLARRLSDDLSVNVTLLEAGLASSHSALKDPKQWPFLADTEFDWKFKTTPQEHTNSRSHGWPRGRVLGGSSSINAMAHVRGHPNDFDSWEIDGCLGWGYADLLPYFVRSETSPYSESPYHGTQGPLQLMQPSDPHPVTRCFMSALEDHGYQPIDEHNGQSMIGPTLNTMTIVNNQRLSVADAYLTPILPRDNLKILDRCLVDKLLIDKHNRCIGVTYIRDNKQHHVYADNGVILCSGTIGSPQILLRSGIGSAEHLETLCIKPRVNLPMVGKNLHDHCLGAGNVYESRRPLPKSKYQHSESLFYLDNYDTTPAPDLVFACATLPVVTEQFEAPNPSSAYTLLYGVTSPESRGFLRLQSGDPCAAPIIDPQYLSTSKDRDRFVDALDFARDIGGSKMFADWRKKEYLPGLEVRSETSRRDFNRAAAYTHHHPVGTCRMGLDSEAVISSDLSVYGTENLFIVDGSIIPKITTGPTNAAIVAMAEKASDILLKRPLLGRTYI